jgi:hypothetical protein
MDNIFFISAIISIVFFIAKFIEMRFVEKESKPLKFLIRDALLVYFSVVFGNFVIGQINPVLSGGGSSSKPNITPVFTDNPGF